MNENRGENVHVSIETLRASLSKNWLTGMSVLCQYRSCVIESSGLVHLQDKATLLTRKPFDWVYDPVYMTYLMLLFSVEKWSY
jgi:hypothetical protein